VIKTGLWLILLAGLLAIFPVSAQDTLDPFAAINCLDLSDSDCAIVQSALRQTEKIHSFSHQFTFLFAVSNASFLVQGLDTAVSAHGGGTFALDLDQTTESDPFSGFGMTLDVTGVEGNNLKALHTIIADGNFYIQNGGTGIWQGASLPDLIINPPSLNISYLGLNFSTAQLMHLGMGILGSSGLNLMLGDDMDTAKLLQTPGFLTQSRQPDETLNGQTVRVFQYTGDIGVLVSNPDVQNLIRDLGARAAESDNEMAQQMALLLPVLLENSAGNVIFTRWIGKDDKLPYRFALDIDASIDLGITSGKGDPIPPIDVNIQFALDFTDINTTPLPSIPADAILVPAAELLTS
jgi:hypothetical protein